MKINPLKPRSTTGNVLLIVMGTTIIIGILIASYLLLVQNQNTSVYRSQSWNSNIPVTEAGVEEALAHLNSDIVTEGNDLNSDGWTARTNSEVQAPRRYRAGGP